MIIEWILRSTRRFHMPIFMAMLLLYGIGLAGIYSASINVEHIYFWKQLIWGGISLFAFLIAFLLPARMYFGLSWILYGFSLVLLVLILVAGSVQMGAERWFSLGPLHFQPSELAKISLILALSRYFTDNRQHSHSPRFLLTSLLLALVPWFLIILQPDLGTSLVLVFIMLPMIIGAGVPFQSLFILLTPLVAMLASLQIWVLVVWLILLAALLWRMDLSKLFLLVVVIINGTVGLLVPRLWNMLHGYQQQRILTFINPELDPLGAGYQIIQSRVAVGSGGLIGKGFTQGTQVYLDFLPAKHTDFIFSVLGEEFGLWGTTLILLLFSGIIYGLIYYAFRHRNLFSGHLLLGIASLLFFHVLINIGMTIGLMPVTGLPLPFMSYGGSFLISNFFLMGLALNLILHRREYS